MAAAVCTAASRSVSYEDAASTSRMWQWGQTAETASRSSEISTSHEASAAGSGEVAPFSLTFLKQPDWLVHAGRPYVERYTARSASAVGSSYASTIATVSALPPVCERYDRSYACSRYAGVAVWGGPAAAGWAASFAPGRDRPDRTRPSEASAPTCGRTGAPFERRTSISPAHLACPFPAGGHTSRVVTCAGDETGRLMERTRHDRAGRRGRRGSGASGCGGPGVGRGLGRRAYPRRGSGSPPRAGVAAVVEPPLADAVACRPLWGAGSPCAVPTECTTSATPTASTAATTPAKSRTWRRRKFRRSFTLDGCSMLRRPSRPI